jgi:WD40 repeat protein
VCRFSRDNKLLACGGEDSVVRVYEFDKPDFTSSKLVVELTGHIDSVNSIDISPDKKMLISSSADKSCIIYSLERQGVKLQKLTFNDGMNPNSKNMLMRGCFFTNDGNYIYTLASQMRQSSYLIKWKATAPFDPVDVTQAHNNTAGGMRLSACGN